MTRPAPVRFCGDDGLAYTTSRTVFAAGEGLRLDETYRLAHLPLLAPSHAGVIATREGTSYQMGRHEPIYSLVLPVPGAALAQSAGYCALEEELRRSPFADKIAWDILPKRQAKLHATICGTLASGPAPRLDERELQELARLGPVSVELRGLFSGNVNVGRLYLRAYPECRGGSNMFHVMQRTLGRPETGLYVVGIFNLTDDLDAAEAYALRELIDRWWERPLLRFETEELWLLGACDDLVLDSEVVKVVPLV